MSVPDDICSKITYTYERDENLVYHKTRYVNLLLREISTPIVAIWDADIIFSLSQLEASIQAIIERKYVMSIPYNGVVKMLSKKQSETYILSGQMEDHYTTYGILGENSRYSIEKLAFINRMEFIKVCSMGQNELRAYVKSW